MGVWATGVIAWLRTTALDVVIYDTPCLNQVFSHCWIERDHMQFVFFVLKYMLAAVPAVRMLGRVAQAIRKFLLKSERKVHTRGFETTS